MISWYIWPLAKNVPFLGMKQKKIKATRESPITIGALLSNYCTCTFVTCTLRL
jgi:hypothetical protein